MDTDNLYPNRFYILIVASDETHFKIIARTLQSIDKVEILHSPDKLEGLSEIFTQKPDLVIAAFEDNSDSLAFIKLIRNNPEFRKLPVFVVFPKPLSFSHKWMGKQITARFTFPLPQKRLHQEVQKLIEKKKKTN